MERAADGSYRGTFTVRVGPATMTFRGELRDHDIDPVAHSLRLVGKGTDSTGTSGASMDLTARVESTGDGASLLVGKSEVTMSGKAATFGARMMTAVSDQILKQFGEKFAAETGVHGPGAGAVTPTPTAGATDAVGSLPAPSASRAPAAQELNGLALLWAVFRDWLRHLFSRKTA